MIAKAATEPSFINDWNVEELKEAILNNSNVQPRVNYVKKHFHGKEMKIKGWLQKTLNMVMLL